MTSPHIFLPERPTHMKFCRPPIFFILISTFVSFLGKYGVESSHPFYPNLQFVDTPIVSPRYRTAYHFQPPKHWINGKKVLFFLLFLGSFALDQSMVRFVFSGFVVRTISSSVLILVLMVKEHYESDTCRFVIVNYIFICLIWLYI